MWGDRKTLTKVGSGGEAVQEFRLGSSVGMGPPWESWRLGQEPAEGKVFSVKCEAPAGQQSSGECGGRGWVQTLPLTDIQS